MTEYYKEDFYDEYAIKKGDTVIAIVDSGSNARKIVECLNNLHEENQSLKASATMYRKLFLELQKQLKGVRKASDLDSKDFEDLIELSKGNVFDDEIGWIHLPVKNDLE